MASWVRYSVAVYMGLLISGALARPQWQPPSSEPMTLPSVYHNTAPNHQHLPAVTEPQADSDVSV